MAVGGTNKKFVVVACINIVVAANAGGAFGYAASIVAHFWLNGKYFH